MSTSPGSIFPASLLVQQLCCGLWCVASEAPTSPTPIADTGRGFLIGCQKNMKSEIFKSCSPLEDSVFSSVLDAEAPSVFRRVEALKSWLQAEEGWLRRWPCLAVALMGAWSSQDAVVPWKVMWGMPVPTSVQQRQSVLTAVRPNPAGSASAQARFPMLWSHLLMALQTYC